MELLQLRYFQTVAEMESISKAAAYYHIPQPSMSQTISRLERELGGIKLFDRVNNRLHLNSNGRLFLQYVEKALLELDNGVQAISSSKAEISGTISLLVMESRRFILSCVSKFAGLYPTVNFRISHDYNSNLDWTYDLCVSSVKIYQQMRTSQPLIQEQIILAIHEDHPLAKMDRLDLSQLCDEKFITLSSHSSMYTITYESCRAAGFEPHIPFICDDPYYVRKYISEKMGVALAPELSWAGRFRPNTKLIPLDPPIYTTSYLVWDEHRYLSPAVCLFRNFLIQEARALPGNILYAEPPVSVRRSAFYPDAFANLQK